MSFEESLNIMKQALDLWKEAGENPSENQYYDFISLATLAINRAGEPVAGYHSILAQVHFDVDNFPAAWEEADKTLLIDENDFKAQLIKTFIAFGLYGEILENTQQKKRGLWSALSDVVSASKQGVRGTFAAGKAGSRVGDILGSSFAPGYAKKSFLQEVAKLITIFENLCQQGLRAGDFEEFSRRLIKLNDGLQESNISLDRNMNLYGMVANAPTNNITFENDQERQKVETIKLIAAGRMSL